MNYFLIRAIPVAGIGDEESTFWIQILVVVLLAVFVGIYSLVKNRQKAFNKQQRIANETGAHHAKSRWQFQFARKYIAMGKDIMQKHTTKTRDMRLHTTDLLREPTLDFDSPDTASRDKLETLPAVEKNKDLNSGMELLELDFLLSVVENTEGNNQKDVTMRKLNFNELIRRKKLNQVNSNALKAYAINRGNVYGKDIQCKAIEELAERTSHKSKHNPLQPATLISL